MTKEPLWVKVVTGVAVTAIFVVLLLMTGCAPAFVMPTSFTGICGLKPLGQNEQGIAFVLAHCEAQK